MAVSQTTRKRMESRAKMMKAVNRPMRRVLRLPFPTPPSRRLMVVTHVGRRTGRTYEQPVSYVRDGETLLAPGGGRWTRNLNDGQAVDLSIAGQRVIGRPERVRDPDEVSRPVAFAAMKAAVAVATPDTAMFEGEEVGDGRAA